MQTNELNSNLAVAQLIGSFIFAVGTISACKLLQEGMLSRMMTNPMSFFDTTPIGRIVNRFSKDVDVVDNILPMTLRTALICFLSVISFSSLIKPDDEFNF